MDSPREVDLESMLMQQSTARLIRIHALEAEVAALKERPTWTPVSELLPEVGTECLYWFNGKWWPGRYLGTDGEYGLAMFGGVHGFVTGDVTHWMVPGEPSAALARGGQG